MATAIQEGIRSSGVERELPPERLCFILEQYPGDAICVPPGWMHAVVNTHACIKLAWDYIDVMEFPAYISAWRDLASRFTPDENANDYMVPIKLVPEVTSKWWRCFMHTLAS